MRQIGEEWVEARDGVNIRYRVVDIARVNSVVPIVRQIGAIEGDECEVLRVVGVTPAGQAEELTESAIAQAGADSGAAYMAGLAEAADRIARAAQAAGKATQPHGRKAKAAPVDELATTSETAPVAAVNEIETPTASEPQPEHPAA